MRQMRMPVRRIKTTPPPQAPPMNAMQPGQPAAAPPAPPRGNINVPPRLGSLRHLRQMMQGHRGGGSTY